MEEADAGVKHNFLNEDEKVILVVDEGTQTSTKIQLSAISDINRDTSNRSVKTGTEKQIMHKWRQTYFLWRT